MCDDTNGCITNTPKQSWYEFDLILSHKQGNELFFKGLWIYVLPTRVHKLSFCFILVPAYFLENV